MRFGAPSFLFLFFLWVPAIIVYFAVARRLRGRFLSLFAPGRRGEVAPLGERMLWTRRVLLVTALALLTFAAARPQMGSGEVNLSASGIDIAVAFDMSLSMLAEDEDGPRFEKGKRLLIAAIAELGGARIAIVPFAGSAFLQLPLTSDHQTALAVANNLTPGMIERQGTALGAAIGLALETLASGDPNSDKLLVVVSDGEDPTLDFDRVKEALTKAKVSLAILPLGTTAGAPINLGGRNLTDERGETVISKLNRGFFDKCRDALGAVEIDRGSTLARFVAQFRNRTGQEERRVLLYREQFQAPLTAGLFLLVLFFALPVGRKEEER